MRGLSEDDLNLSEMTDDELALAWDLWFDLAQATNEYDPPYTHGVFVNVRIDSTANPETPRLIAIRPPTSRAAEDGS